MIAAWLAERAAATPDRVFLATPEGRLTYAECARRVEVMRARIASCPGRAVGLAGAADSEFYVALLTLDGLASRLYVLPQDLDATTVGCLSRKHSFEVFDPLAGPRGATAMFPEVCETEVVLFTSGTAGVPKPALHTWRSITAGVHTGETLDGSRWLLTFSPASYAGLQVFLHALANGGQLSLGPPRVAELAELARRDATTHLSGTPTFFRLLLSIAQPDLLAGLSLKQITLGGEPVDQPILDALRRRFPDALMTHIYASTEAGVGFSVHDGKAGFPASYLGTTGGATQLRIVDDELQVHTRGGMRRYLDEPRESFDDAWLATGDLVRVDEDRVYFLGRRSERINVGGNKLSPAEVEQVLHGIEGIRGARVYGTPNPLTGQIVCADIVLPPGADAGEMRLRILSTCRARLPAYKVPRILRFVERLEMTPAGKTARG